MPSGLSKSRQLTVYCTLNVCIMADMFIRYLLHCLIRPYLLALCTVQMLFSWESAEYAAAQATLTPVLKSAMVVCHFLMNFQNVESHLSQTVLVSQQLSLQQVVLCDHSLCLQEAEVHILHPIPPSTSHTDLPKYQFGKKLSNSLSNSMAFF